MNTIVGEDELKSSNPISKYLETLEVNGVFSCLQEVPWIIIFKSLDTIQPYDMSMKESYDKKDYSISSVKYSKSPSTNKRKSSEELVFWT
jgi:hypothetical protein